MARRVLLLLMFVSLLLAACGDGTPTPAPAVSPTATVGGVVEGDATPTVGSGGFGAGYISGRTSYADGKPLTNVKVTITSAAIAGENSYFELDVDDKGYYVQKVPNGLYEIKAYIKAQYKDRTYGLWLDPIDGIDTPTQDSSNDIIKDFVWKVSGPSPAAKSKPDSPFSYYGGVVEVGNNSEFEMQYNNGNLVEPFDYPAGSIIRLVLSPDGPLVDGSEGATVEHEVDPQTLTDEILRDIPLGDYTVKATLIEENGKATELQVATIIPGGPIGEEVVPAESAPVVFKPEAFGSFGIQSVKLFVLPGE